MIRVTPFTTFATLIMPALVALATLQAWRTYSLTGTCVVALAATFAGGALLGIVWGPQFRRHWTLPIVFIIIAATAYGWAAWLVGQGFGQQVLAGLVGYVLIISTLVRWS